MTGRAPRIGLTTYYKEAAWGDWRRTAALTPATYVEAVVRAGGVPLLLPPRGTDVTVVDALDALVVIGGSDVDPAHYGQERHPRTRPEPHRDEHELSLVLASLERGIPLLAVCRGVQVLNVALGGTLHQHLPDVLSGLADDAPGYPDTAGGGTAYQPAPGVFGEVRLRTAPGSRIAAAVGATMTVPCYHHQGIDRVGDGLSVTARSDDGVVQALEPDGPAWVLGVQFHPEEGSSGDRLFSALVQAACRRSPDAQPAPTTEGPRRPRAGGAQP